MREMVEAARHMNKIQSIDALAQLISTAGSATHPFVRTMRTESPATARTLADLVHHLGQLHGRHPGMIECLAARDDVPHALSTWLANAQTAMRRERHYLTRILVAAGPLPSTPHHDRCEAELAGIGHAIDMLARSERLGCAAGAALALLHDWAALRHLLDNAATRFGVEPTPLALPDVDETAAAFDTLASDAATARAIDFGAHQLLAQHRALLDLMARRERDRSPT